MKYKIALVSLLLMTTTAALAQNSRGVSGSSLYTNHWAMVALFWSSVSHSQPVINSSTVVHEVSAVAIIGERAEVAAADSQEEFRWQGRVQAGQALEVKGVNGSVRAEGSSGNQIEVVARKRAERSDTKEVEIRVVEHAGGVTICAVYPSEDPSRPNECQPGGDGRMSVRNNDVEVNFIVKVPAGVRFIGRTVNGGVDATGIGSDVEATTVNGGITISASGIAQATTVNGSIKALMGNANWPSELKFNTVNGSITLDFPANLSAEVRAETLNGELSSDFPMNIESSSEGGRGRPKRMTATIGSGGRSLTLKTINGDIRLRRAAERSM